MPEINEFFRIDILFREAYIKVNILKLNRDYLFWIHKCTRNTYLIWIYHLKHWNIWCQLTKTSALCLRCEMNTLKFYVKAEHNWLKHIHRHILEIPLRNRIAHCMCLGEIVTRNSIAHFHLHISCHHSTLTEK